MNIRVLCSPILSWLWIMFSKRLCYDFSTSSIIAVKKSLWVIWFRNRGFWVMNIVFWIVKSVLTHLVDVSLFSKISPIWDCRIPQFVEPCWKCPLWFSVLNPGLYKYIDSLTGYQLSWTWPTFSGLWDNFDTLEQHLGNLETWKLRNNFEISRGQFWDNFDATCNFWRTLGQLLDYFGTSMPIVTSGGAYLYPLGSNRQFVSFNLSTVSANVKISALHYSKVWMFVNDVMIEHGTTAAPKFILAIGSRGKAAWQRGRIR